MTARIIRFPARTSVQLTAEQLMERAAELLRDPARAARSASLSRRYVEHAIKTVESDAAVMTEQRAEACEALRDGLAMMVLALSMMGGDHA